MTFQIKVEGVQAAMDALPDPKGLNKVLGDASVAGAKVYRAAMRKTGAFKNRTGRLRKSIGYRRLRSGAGADVGPRGRGSAHANLVEKGHGGPHLAPAHPFVEPTFTEFEAAAMEAAEAVILQAIGD